MVGITFVVDFYHFHGSITFMVVITFMGDTGRTWCYKLKLVCEVNKALRFPFLQTQHKLKQELLKLAVKKYCIHNLGEDQRKVNNCTSENKK